MTRILVVSDEASPSLEKSLPRKDLWDVDLILSCGDLPYDYLEYLVDALDAPLLYVHGNHDRPIETERRCITEPQGCISVDGTWSRQGGLWVAGLGGSPRYQSRNPYQYTEGEMRRRTLRLEAKLGWRRLLRGGPLDILLTHAPPRGVHDGPDPVHTGFSAFLGLLRRHRPRYHLHGHSYPRPGYPTRTRYLQTEVIHVRGHALLEVPADG